MIMEIAHIHKEKDNQEIIKDLSFSIDHPNVVALVGPNGAGKTTLLNLLSGLTTINKGSIKIFKQDINKNRIKILESLAFMQDSTTLYPYLKGIDHLQLVAKLRNRKKEDIDKVISDLNIQSYINKKVKKYSLGMKQHLLLALAIVGKPKIIFLDEPLNGLDPSSAQMLVNLILKLKNEGTTILFSSHMLTEVDKVADTILFIKDGRIIKEYINKERTKNNFATYNLKVNNNDFDRALKLLSKKEEWEIHKKKTMITISSVALNINNILSILNEENIEILELEKEKKQAEFLYNDLYGDLK